MVFRSERSFLSSTMIFEIFTRWKYIFSFLQSRKTEEETAKKTLYIHAPIKCNVCAHIRMCIINNCTVKPTKHDPTDNAWPPGQTHENVLQSARFVGWLTFLWFYCLNRRETRVRAHGSWFHNTRLHYPRHTTASICLWYSSPFFSLVCFFLSCFSFLLSISYASSIPLVALNF